MLAPMVILLILSDSIKDNNQRTTYLKNIWEGLRQFNGLMMTQASLLLAWTARALCGDSIETVWISLMQVVAIIIKVLKNQKRTNFSDTIIKVENSKMSLLSQNLKMLFTA